MSDPQTKRMWSGGAYQDREGITVIADSEGVAVAAHGEQTDYLDEYFVGAADPNLDRLDSARRTWERHGYL